MSPEREKPKIGDGAKDPPFALSLGLLKCSDAAAIHRLHARLVAIRHLDALPKHALMGWEVGFTDDGPIVAEANVGSGVDMLQRPHRQPLGGTRPAELVLHHLRHGKVNASQ